MIIDEFCDIYAVAPRDRVASKIFFTARGILAVTEEEWVSHFDSAKFNLGKTAKSRLKELIVKSVEQLSEIARQYPEEEWKDISNNKAKLAKYLSNK